MTVPDQDTVRFDKEHHGITITYRRQTPDETPHRAWYAACEGISHIDLSKELSKARFFDDIIEAQTVMDKICERARQYADKVAALHKQAKEAIEDAGDLYVG